MSSALLLVSDETVLLNEQMFKNPIGIGNNFNINFKIYKNITVAFIKGKQKKDIISLVSNLCKYNYFDKGLFLDLSLKDPEMVAIWLFLSGFWFTIINNQNLTMETTNISFI